MLEFLSLKDTKSVLYDLIYMDFRNRRNQRGEAESQPVTPGTRVVAEGERVDWEGALGNFLEGWESSRP